MPVSPVPEDKGPTFEPSVHWCPRHLTPFRERWPRGWPIAMLALFEECVRNTEILAALGYVEGKSDADTRMLDRVLREFSPLCCFLGDEVTAKWTKLSLGPQEDMLAALATLRASGV